jgi:hypothetical protein
MEEAFMASEIRGKLVLSAPSISSNSFWMCIMNSELIIKKL